MARSDNLTGALLMMASMAGFTFNDAAMKAMAGQVPLYQLLFLRGVLTTLAVLFLAWRMKALAPRLPRRDKMLIGLRIVAETGAAYFFLTALFNMPIANVTAILQALPLTVTLVAALAFREPVGWRRFLAILAGFLGVLLIVRPGAEDFNAFSVYALMAVLCVTVRDLATRRLSSATPSIFVTLATSASIMAVFGLASLAAPWAAMGPREAGLTAFAALCIICGYLCSIMVMRVGEISFVAPFRYTGLIWALALGWIVFGEWPAWQTLLGAGIVAASGVFTLYREARLARRRPPLPTPHSR
ncbi:DMT family transporter [Roseovarius aestuariivivens]|uniref:DMT family transporter n=1 Tax=Roseovarius aestuariivivens TaxID=1888910 RepID=UPI00107FE4CE|nr:DMT family transporter [Roseovarius aestuariivivens]